MNANETIKEVSYSGTTRTETVEREITLADDYATMGNICYRLADVNRSIERETSRGADADNTLLEALISDRDRLLVELRTVEGYLDGYSV